MTLAEFAVIDASAFVRDQLGDRPAGEWIERAWSCEITLIAPALIFAEVSNALLGYVRRGELTVDEALDGIADLHQLVQPTPLDALYPAAFELGLDRGLSAYDAAYAQLAESEEIPLVTADRKLAAATARGVLLE